jgi:two-component system, OmpR family, phosphate regulon response regulator PhoB
MGARFRLRSPGFAANVGHMAKHILIVEDDADMVELLQLALRRAGHDTSFAATGTEALTKARRSPPDLVVLDLMLPEVNGFNVCETLRRDEATAAVPIIMITALPGELPRLAGVEMGAAAYFHKPFKIEDLVARVDSVLGVPHLPVGADPISPNALPASPPLF